MLIEVLLYHLYRPTQPYKPKCKDIVKISTHVLAEKCQQTKRKWEINKMASVKFRPVSPEFLGNFTVIFPSFILSKVLSWIALYAKDTIELPLDVHCLREWETGVRKLVAGLTGSRLLLDAIFVYVFRGPLAKTSTCHPGFFVCK